MYSYVIKLLLFSYNETKIFNLRIYEDCFIEIIIHFNSLLLSLQKLKQSKN